MSRRELICYLGDALLTQCTLGEGADHQANHLVEETVAIEVNRDAPIPAANTDTEDCPHSVCFGVAPICREGGEVMSADELLRRVPQLDQI